MTAVAEHGVCARLWAVRLVLVLIGAGAAGAQEMPLEPGAPAEPRYKVELIVFAYDRGVPHGNEVFPPEAPPLPYSGPAEDEGAGGEPLVFGDPAVIDAQPAGDDDRQAEPGDPFAAEPGTRRIALELLEAQDARMEDIYRRLVNIDAYHPLMRAAWIQSTPGKAEAPAIHLQALGAAPPELDGTVTLYLGRFVHLVVDVALDAGDDAAAATATTAPADDTPVYFGDDRPDGLFAAPVVRYRIAEDRIMRDGEVRYYDHPRFGVIARVTRSAAAADDDVPGTDEVAAGR